MPTKQVTCESCGKSSEVDAGCDARFCKECATPDAPQGQTPKLTFADLWVGDRFTVGGPIWTKLNRETARRHETNELALAGRGYGYIGAAICSFEQDQVVDFVPVNTHTQLVAACEELLTRVKKTPINAAKGMMPVCVGDIERWESALAHARTGGQAQ